MLKQLHKQTLIGYILPIISALIVLYIPEYDNFFGILTIVIFILLLMLPLFLHVKYIKRRNKDIIFRLTTKYIMYTFLLYFTFPLLKVFTNNLLIQVLLITFFIGVLFMARYDQNTNVPIIYPGNDKDHKKIAYVYYAMPFIFILAAGGGNIIISRKLTDLLGYNTAMMLFSIVLYLFSCWILFLFSSLAYKSHVKEGFLDK